MLLLASKPTAAARKTVLAHATGEDRLAFGERELFWLPSGGISDSDLDLRAIEKALPTGTMRTHGTIERLAAKFLRLNRLSGMRSDAFIDAVHSLSKEKLEAVLDPDVKFFSPVSFRSYDGRDLVVLILTEGPMKLFEDFEYVHAIEGPDEPIAALIFRTRVGDKWMDGLDLLTFGEDGLITELKVMLRPKSAVDAMAAAMGERFEELGLTQPSA